MFAKPFDSDRKRNLRRVYNSVEVVALSTIQHLLIGSPLFVVDLRTPRAVGLGFWLHLSELIRKREDCPCNPRNPS